MNQNKNILLVEDKPEERIALCDILSGLGFTVTAVGDGYSGLSKFSNEEYRLVISDLMMPNMDGMELLSKIKERKEKIPVVLITGYGTVEYAVEAMKRGAYDFILKPYSMQIIETIVAKAFGNEDYFERKTKNDVKKPSIITNNQMMLRLLDLAKTVANSKAPIFIQGESGTGKELFAKFIHNEGGGIDKPFVALNCAALPTGLLESELFGHEKGAFTGAIAKKLGKFELAHNGTILLDEISEMDINLQAKLLRVLQELEVDRVGGKSPIPIDVRVIATTNQNIEEAVKKEKFRSDLYYRLNVIPLKIPPLRERKEDIIPLVNHFISKYNKIDEKNIQKIEEDAAAALRSFDWPGNVRELENIIERAVLLCNGEIIQKKDLFIYEFSREVNESEKNTIGSLKEMEKKMILKALDKTNGNRTHAADILGISVRTLRNKLTEYKEKMATF